MKYVYGLVVCGVLSSCASAPQNFSDQDVDRIESAVNKNDYAFISSELHRLKPRKRSLAEGIAVAVLALQPASGGYNNGTYEYRVYEILDYAIAGKANQSRPYATCKVDVVKSILSSSGVAARDKDLVNAARLLCPDVAKVILDQLPVQSIVKAVDGYREKLHQTRDLSSEVQIGANGERIIELHSEMLKQLSRWVSDKCMDSDLQSAGICVESLAGIGRTLASFDEKLIERSNQIKVVQDIEKKFKKKFCEQSEIMNGLAQGIQYEFSKDCLYTFAGGDVRPVQKLPGGVLLVADSPYFGDVFFLVTGKQFKSATKRPLIVNYKGDYTYTTVLGALRMVPEFDALMAIEVREHADYGKYHVVGFEE